MNDLENSLQSSSDTRSRRRLTLLIPIFLANRDSATSSTSQTSTHAPSRGLLVLVLSLSNDAQTQTLGGTEENSIEDVLNRLFQSHRPQGPPPASQKALDALEVVTIEGTLKQEAPRCTICFEDFVFEKDIIVRLPCNSTHVFHRDCIGTWLKQHGTCPICRHQLPTDNSRITELTNEQPQESNTSEIPPLVENRDESNTSNLNVDLESIFRSLAHESQNTITQFDLPSAVNSPSTNVHTYNNFVQTQIEEGNQRTTDVPTNITQLQSPQPSRRERILRWLRNRLPRPSCFGGSAVLD